MYWNCFSVLPLIVLPLISCFAHIGRACRPSFSGLREAASLTNRASFVRSNSSAGCLSGSFKSYGLSTLAL